MDHCSLGFPNRQIDNGFLKPSAMERTITVTETAAAAASLLSNVLLKYPDTSLKMEAASIYIPKDNPNRPRGEDAHFICAEAQTVGLADGVGGWSRLGIDAGEYARQLMSNSFAAAQNLLRNGILINPKKVLQEAYDKTAVDGSSTACIITLCWDKICAANVGDSGFLVIRNGEIVYRSPVQQRRFNCPYQLGKTKDEPGVAKEIEFAVRPGDLVVVGTDGLFDNVHNEEMVEIVRRMDGESNLKERACYLANIALYNSLDRFAKTPFSVAAKKAGRSRRGGKEDDITVILVRIK